MAKAHSYRITLSNNKTENEALQFLVSRNEGFYRPDTQSRKDILRLMGLPDKFFRTFDLIRTDRASIKDGVLSLDPDKLTLIELKSTKKKLPEHPAGFFFGATENEFDLARLAGDRMRFCFVCLHPETLDYALLTLAELEARIKTKRVQYQINL